MRCELVILYRLEGGGAVTVAAISDRELMGVAAMKAIEESERVAAALAGDDRVLGAMQHLEALWLKGVLEMLLPDMARNVTAEVVMKYADTRPKRSARIPWLGTSSIASSSGAGSPPTTSPSPAR